MGNTESLIPKTNAEFPYFCICFRRADRLMLLHANREVEENIRSTLKNWKEDGIADRIRKHGAKVYKLKDNPLIQMNAHGHDKGADEVRVMFCELLSNLSKAGWNLSLSTDLSLENDLSTWYFEKSDDMPEQSSIHTVCVSIHGDRKVHIVNSTEALRPVIKASIASWVKEEKITNDFYEVTLRGSPWNPDDKTESVIGNRVIIGLIRGLHSNGYRVAGTFRSEEQPDTIFFQQNDSLVHGDDADDFMLMSFNGENKIRLVESGTKISDIMKNTIAKNWNEGIERYKFSEKEQYAEAKLGGSPWLSENDQQQTRVLLCQIFDALAAYGWLVYCSLECGTEITEKAVVVFRKTKRDKPTTQHICVFPSAVNKIRIINGSRNMADESISETIENHWPIVLHKGFVKDHAHEVSDVCELQLAGNPWSGREHTETLVTRHMMMAVKIRLQSLGFWPAASVPFILKSDGEEKSLDSWFFTNQSPQKSEAGVEKAALSIVSMPQPEHYEGDEAKSALDMYHLKTAPKQVGIF